MEKRTIRFGIIICAAAAVLRFLTLGAAMPLLFFLETGRHTQVSASGGCQGTIVPEFSETAPVFSPEPLPDPQIPLPAFGAADLQFVELDWACDARADTQMLMEKSLSWDLRGSEPTVLILHTHATESFRGTDGYRSTDEAENMLSIGQELARLLEAGGIRVIHDRTLYDHPNYSGAYSAARKGIQGYLEQYPSIRLVLDLHRDAAAGDAGALVTSATLGGQQSAQLMLVVGTDESGLSHPNWQENLSLALKLTAFLEQEHPGLCRPVYVRKQRFNMDLCPGSLLVEVGAAGNYRQEAILAAHALAQGILDLAGGANIPS